MSKQSAAAAEFRPQDMPISWCMEILLNVERGNYEGAANAQRELRRLGWDLCPVHNSVSSRQLAACQGGAR
jgi:hypothetical protein